MNESYQVMTAEPSVLARPRTRPACFSQARSVPVQVLPERAEGIVDGYGSCLSELFFGKPPVGTPIVDTPARGRFAVVWGVTDENNCVEFEQSQLRRGRIESSTSTSGAKAMAEFGYKLSSEEHGPQALVEYAAKAECAGFTFGLISDHFHPWIDKQGHSPFVWGVLGAIAQATSEFRVGTGVTCPTIRIHPAVIAQAAATTAALMPKRFFLGVGSGENLNEHVLGDAWPTASVRLEMLEEAVEVIRLLWQGGQQSHHGKHYTVENARIYSLPDEPPPIYVAASGSKATEIAGRMADGLIGVAPEREIVERYETAGGRGKPKHAEATVCYHEDEAKARQIATEWWPNAVMGGQLGQDLALPSHYEAVAELVTEEKVCAAIACGPDPEQHIAVIKEFLEAGYDHVTIHQVGPDQDSFIGFYEKQILPTLT